MCESPYIASTIIRGLISNYICKHLVAFQLHLVPLPGLGNKPCFYAHHIRLWQSSHDVETCSSSLTLQILNLFWSHFKSTSALENCFIQFHTFVSPVFSKIICFHRFFSQCFFHKKSASMHFHKSVASFSPICTSVSAIGYININVDVPSNTMVSLLPIFLHSSIMYLVACSVIP